MNTSSIVELREHRDEIKKSRRTLKVSKYSNEKYGNEQEYTAKGIAAGIDLILDDISALIKKPAVFIQNSIHAERTQLAGRLGNLNSYLENQDLKSLALTIDEIKPILRSFDVRYTDERMVAFGEQINSIQQEASSLSGHITDVETIKLEGNKLKEEIDSLHQELTEELKSLNTQKEELTESINSTKEERLELDTLLSDDKNRSEEMEDLLATSKSHTEVIDNFIKRIAERESQLVDQEVTTEGYKEILEVFKADHESYISDAKQLIESAKLALEYKTAEGLSAAFTAQYNRADSKQEKRGWLLSAIIFVAASVFLGIWLTIGESVQLEVVIARISLLPILIGGAWFSAGQYVKQKNIAEDYAYKAVLAKSMVGFSDQLSTESNKGEDYSYYVKSVLSKILNDPLRKHGQNVAVDNEATKDTKQIMKE